MHGKSHGLELDLTLSHLENFLNCILENNLYS
jgi:hypothetical protein